MKAWVGLVVEVLSTTRPPLLVRQLFENISCTYSYLIGDTVTTYSYLIADTVTTYSYHIADTVTKECLIIDPVIETVDRDLKLVQEMGLTLKYVVDQNNTAHFTHFRIHKHAYKNTCKHTYSQYAQY